jgi:hypothetical protein
VVIQYIIMKCPKCNHEQEQENSECDNCGIIFTKYYSWIEFNSTNNNSTSSISRTPNAPLILSNLFLHIKPDESRIFFYGRLIIFLGTIFWGFKFITSPIESNYAGESYMHLVNLPFHEAGHIFFRPFGSFMGSLGGTVGQFIFPMICFGVLLIKTRDPFGASITLWWFGQNFFDVAPYINDARSLSLPLLGGNYGHSSPYGFHDWEYLLTESGLLSYDHFIAKLSFTIGILFFIVSFAWSGILLCKQFRNNIT